MTSSRLLYLSAADVAAAGPDLSTMIGLLETAFREKGEGRVEMPPKPGVHPRGDAFIHAMPAYIPTLRSAGVKWVSGYPENQARGLPYISGLLILNDVETGIPMAVMDCTWITAYRTAAASALSARYLARPESETVGILACGVQGRTNLEALTTVFPVRRAYAYDIVPETERRFVEEMGAKLGIEIIAADGPRRAVSECDIVVTSGPILKHPKPAIEAGWFKEGAFASPVDFDSYWKPAAMALADKYCTDDTKQLEYYRSVGYFQKIPPVYGDLGEIVAGKKPGRQRDNERTISANLGLALEDMATAIRIYKIAREKGIGRMLPL